MASTKADFKAEIGSVGEDPGREIGSVGEGPGREIGSVGEPETQNARRMRLMKEMGEIVVPLCGKDRASGA